MTAIAAQYAALDAQYDALYNGPEVSDREQRIIELPPPG